MLPPHQTQYVNHDGLRLFTRHCGEPGALPILILHGLSYFSYDWLPIASRLAADREVVAMDLRGFGESDWSPQRAYGLRDFAGDAVAVLDHYGWEQAIIVGHSMGGRIALCTTHWHPERIAGLACLDFAPDVAPAGRMGVAKRIGNQPDWFASVDEALSYHGHPADLPADHPQRLRYEAFLKPGPEGFQLRRDLHFRDTFLETLQTGKPAPSKVDLWAMVQTLKVPTLFVRGLESDMFEMDTIAKLEQSNSLVETLQIVGTHDLAGDNPDGVVQAVQALTQRCAQMP